MGVVGICGGDVVLCCLLRVVASGGVMSSGAVDDHAQHLSLCLM